MKTIQQRLILNELLNRYERSRLFKNGESKQAVFLRFSDCREITGQIHTPEDKQAFLDALEDLRQKNLLTYTWIRYETGNLVDKIYLPKDKETIGRCYKEIGRRPKWELLECLKDRLRETAGRMQEGDLKEFLLEMKLYIEEKQEIPSYLFKPFGSLPQPVSATASCADGFEEKNNRLLLFLETMSRNEFEQLERVLSARLYGDSKYFERELRSKVFSILKYLSGKAGRTGDETDGASLLEERGVFKWPEIMEFCGPVEVDLDTGQNLDFTSHIYGAYMNSDTIRHVKEVHTDRLRKIMLIENKANYTWYLSAQKKEDELVLYHGGFFSPAKGCWFQKIAEASRGQDVTFLHWGDIDLGGFRMFHRLKKEIFPTVEPFRMDLHTLEAHRSACRPLDSQTCRKELERLQEDAEYRVFSGVITYMLENDVKLEQEQLI